MSESAAVVVVVDVDAEAPKSPVGVRLSTSTSSRSWADMVEDDDDGDLGEFEDERAACDALDMLKTSMDARVPIEIASSAAPVSSARSIAELVSRVPDSRAVYNTLRDCAMIDRSAMPPQSYRGGSGTPLQVAIYESFYFNPRGSNVRADAPVCYCRLLDCVHARVVATIYAIAAAREPGVVGAALLTEERISAIPIAEFRAIFGGDLRIVGALWFGTWPLFLNSKLHVETCNHACHPRCMIVDAPRNPLRDSEEHETLQRLIAVHRATYCHTPMPYRPIGQPMQQAQRPGFRARPAGASVRSMAAAAAATVPARAPAPMITRAPAKLSIERKMAAAEVTKRERVVGVAVRPIGVPTANPFSALDECTIAGVIEATRKAGKKRAKAKTVTVTAIAAAAPSDAPAQ